MWLQRLERLADRLWAPPIALIEAIGAHIQLLGTALFWLIRPPYRVTVVLEAMVFLGVESLLIVLLIAFFVGAVFSLQLINALRTFQAEAFVGATVGLALTRELAVLTPAAPATLHARAPTRVALFGGAPLDGPRYLLWNFVASTKARLDQARLDWIARRFPTIAADDGYIPFPGA